MLKISHIFYRIKTHLINKNMKSKNAVSHFEIPADDVERAKNFYTELFGWKITKLDMPEDSSTKGKPYYMIHAGETDENGMLKNPGEINGGMMERAHPTQCFMNYISVENIDEMLEKIEAKGGTICMPKTEIGEGMGWIACFKDTENNIMGLHQMA